MHITLSPIRHDTGLSLVRQGDCLIVNGESYDFSSLEEGAALPRDAIDCPWLASDVVRHEGRIRLTLCLPIRAEAPAAARFPAPLEPDNGPVPLPEGAA